MAVRDNQLKQERDDSRASLPYSVPLGFALAGGLSSAAMAFWGPVLAAGLDCFAAEWPAAISTGALTTGFFDRRLPASTQAQKYSGLGRAQRVNGGQPSRIRGRTIQR